MAKSALKVSESRDSLFEEIALPHMDYIFRVAYRLSGNRETAEDLTQETFFIAMQKIGQLKEKAKCKSWLFVILRNLYFGMIEKTRNKYFFDYDDVSYGIQDEKIQEKEMAREGFSDLLQHQLDRLDEKYKAPLVMSVLENFSYKEIAGELDIPIGTVMSRIARGKSFLRREITKHSSFEEMMAD